MNLLKSEDLPLYQVEYLQPAADEPETFSIIAQAIRIIEHGMQSPGAAVETPALARDYVFLQLAQEPAEVFGVLFLDNRHRVIEFRRMFAGTIDGCSVHPREVVRACIELNAAACILAHNHPSGVSEPSQADIKLTRRLIDALALVDVRILDHLIAGDSRENMVSFAERGLI